MARLLIMGVVANGTWQRICSSYMLTTKLLLCSKSPPKQFSLFQNEGRIRSKAISAMIQQQ